MNNRSVGHRFLFVGAMAVIVTSAFATGYMMGRDSSAHTKSENAITASANLPFDASKTSHTFTKTPSGGVQTITANVAMESSDLQSIRSYLQSEAARFNRGEVVSLPTSTALQEVNPGIGRVNVRYTAIPGGGRITYETTDRNLLRSLHAWIDTQASDAASHGH